DFEGLLAKNRIALERMRRLATRVAIPFEPLVVCPQEQCSSEAWRSFAETADLLAMVNTGCMPRNERPPLFGADLLAPAQDAYYGFPIFKRHYSNNSAAFAMALFLGKPAILVEHHDFFREGSARVQEFARNIQRMAPDVKWEPLSRSATTTHWRRVV